MSMICLQSMNTCLLAPTSKPVVGLYSLPWPDHFFPFVLGQVPPTQHKREKVGTRPNTKGEKLSGHARLVGLNHSCTLSPIINSEQGHITYINPIV